MPYVEVEVMAVYGWGYIATGLWHRQQTRSDLACAPAGLDSRP